MLGAVGCNVPAWRPPHHRRLCATFATSTNTFGYRSHLGSPDLCASGAAKDAACQNSVAASHIEGLWIGIGKRGRPSGNTVTVTPPWSILGPVPLAVASGISRTGQIRDVLLSAIADPAAARRVKLRRWRRRTGAAAERESG